MNLAGVLAHIASGHLTASSLACPYDLAPRHPCTGVTGGRAIARHKMIDQPCREARRPRASVATQDVEGIVLAQLSTDAALRLIATLPPEVAEMVSLRVIVGLDVAAVARIVGRRPGTVRVAVHRGLQRLAGQLLAEDVTPARPPALLGRDD
jgi:hypothetical protein